jgi:hypothetical protein
MIVQRWTDEMLDRLAQSISDITANNETNTANIERLVSLVGTILDNQEFQQQRQIELEARQLESQQESQQRHAELEAREAELRQRQAESDERFNVLLAELRFINRRDQP